MRFCHIPVPRHSGQTRVLRLLHRIDRGCGSFDATEPITDFRLVAPFVCAAKVFTNRVDLFKDVDADRAVALFVQSTIRELVFCVFVSR